MDPSFLSLKQSLAGISPVRHGGWITRITSSGIVLKGVEGLPPGTSLLREGTRSVVAEITTCAPGRAFAQSYGPLTELSLGTRLEASVLDGPRPTRAWLGRVVDAFGNPLTPEPLPRSPTPAPLHPEPIPALDQPGLGPRLATGLTLFDTLCPVAKGQKLGLFAGSGVGKTTLLRQLGTGIEADLVVLALIGERGREVRGTLEALPPALRARCICVVATSDRSALEKRRCLWTALSIADVFREEGRHVLLLADSLTRFAEAHRDIALTAGEPAGLGGWPPSTTHHLAQVIERAGTVASGGAITAIFSVLVAGSDMEEPLADTIRGLTDGHILLDRTIAEQGRFPAVDLLRSVSRALPDCASPQELDCLARTRRLLARAQRARPLAEAGLHEAGTDPETDRALSLAPRIEALLSSPSSDPQDAFARLSALLDDAASPEGPVSPPVA